ncbi:MAG: hypothetical protein IJX89_04320 [Alphaproteobacteria bacterium]|nr:hypothetical protein [Alphaproteobacteria bacterium]
MKKIFVLLIVLLAGCDSPDYKLDLLCKNGGENYRLRAEIYDDVADLEITRLSKVLRPRTADNWLVNHTWLGNQVPLIDDVLKISLAGTDGVYEDKGHIKLDIGYKNLTGALDASLWFASDNNLTMADGEVIPNGQYMVGVHCETLIPYKFDKKRDSLNISEAKIKEIKNCGNYIGSQLFSHTVAPRVSEFLVYDADLDRETFLPYEIMESVAGNNKLYDYYPGNSPADKILDACEVAEKLKSMIRQELESVKYMAQVECLRAGKIIPDNGSVKIEVYDNYAIVKNLNFDPDGVILVEGGGLPPITKLFKVQENIIDNLRYIVFENEMENAQLSVVIDTLSNQVIEYSWSNVKERSKDGLRVWQTCE